MAYIPYNLQVDRVALEAYLDVQSEALDSLLKPPKNGGAFWSTNARAQTDPSVEVLEVTFAEPRKINLVAMRLPLFPHTMSMEFHDGKDWVPVRLPKPSPKGSGLSDSEIRAIIRSGNSQWGDPLNYRVGTSNPEFIFAKNAAGREYHHPQHNDSGAHWHQLNWRVLPFLSSRIRVLLQRGRGLSPKDGLTKKKVPYSLAVRDLRIGYRISGIEDVDPINYDMTFNSTTNLLGSRVNLAISKQDARQAISGGGNGSGRGWRSEPMPISHAVVNFYADVRGEDGEAQVIDGFQIDPLTTGPNLSLYWSNDEPSTEYTPLDSPITYPLVKSSDTSPQGQVISQTVTSEEILFVSSASFLTLDNTFLQFDPKRAWWVGFSIRSWIDAEGLDQYGNDQHPMLSFGEATLMADAGTIQFLQGDKVVASVDLHDEHGFESVYTVAVSYEPKGKKVTLTYALEDRDPVSASSALEIALTRPKEIRLGAFAGVDPGMPAMALRGLVLKTDRSMSSNEWELLLNDHTAITGPAEVPWKGSGLLDNALIRMHPRFFHQTANTMAIVGGPGDRYDQMVWTPIPRDYSLRRGLLRLPPTKTKHFKFEITNLIAEHHEVFIPASREVRILPSVLKSMDVRASDPSGETPSATYAPGVDTQKGLVTQPYADAPDTSGESTSGKSQTTRTEALVVSDPAASERVSEAGWLWRYQNWHVGAEAPRFVEVSKHVYEQITIQQKTKVSFFAGIKSIRAVRADYTTPFDTEEIVEHFFDDKNIGAVSGAVVEGDVLNSTTARGTVTSLPFNSSRPVRAIQFASIQSDARLVSQSPSVFAPYGDASLAPHSDGSVQVIRGYRVVEWADLESSYFTTTDLLLRTNHMKNAALTASDAGEIRRNLATGAPPSTNGSVTFVQETFEGETSWRRLTVLTSNHGVRKLVDLTELVDGQTYTASWEVCNTGSTPVTVSVDWCDTNGSTYTIAPGERRRIHSSGMRATYTSSFRFADLAITGVGNSLLIRNCLIERTNRPLPFFDGNTPSDAGLSYSWLGGTPPDPEVDDDPGVPADPMVSMSVATGDIITNPYGYDSPMFQTSGQSPSGASVGASYPMLGNQNLIVAGKSESRTYTTPGTFWAMRMKVRVVGGSGTEQVSPQVRPYPVSGAPFAPVTAAAVTTLTSQFVEISVPSSGPTPANTASVQMLLYAQGTSWQNSSGRLEIADIIIEQVEGVGQEAGPYFSGSTPGVDGTGHKWIGDPNDSPSGSYLLASEREGLYLDLEEYTYFELEGTQRGGEVSGGVEISAIEPPASGVLYGSTIVSVPSSAPNPLTIVSQVLNEDGVVLAEGDEVVSPGETADIVLSHAVGSTLSKYDAFENDALSYGTLESTGSYGHLENVPITGPIRLRTLQYGGESGHTFSVLRSGVFETTVQWEFSVDGGVTWVSGMSVRNNTNGVLSFPDVGTNLMWRATLTSEDASVSALAIRPWYGVFDKGQPYYSDTTPLGPNRAPSEVFQPIESDPMWQVGAVEIPSWWYAPDTTGPAIDVDNTVDGGWVEDHETFLTVESGVDIDFGGPEGESTGDGVIVLEGY